ncbi:MAG TPA: carboxypeptidase regulatory-like domain-containing protein [Kofleriaceae bacterium]|nr:carboxypeptidase regulatory-like domain-containing protein [Kofleriaceae bacterium]
MKRVLALLLFVAACSGPGDRNSGDDDGMQPDGGTDPSVTCGDVVVDGSEQCDDGNTASGDGCSATCETEASGGTCSPHSFRCNTAGDVETCNNAGTAWLQVEHCTAGCASGACSDPTCTPGATRCHGKAVETCNAGGTAWTQTEQCTATYCAAGQCALPALDVGSNSNYHGTVIVAGDVLVNGNSTLTADTGDLTIVADNITVEAGAAIAVAPTGENTQGQGCYYSYYGYAEPANYGQSPTGYMVSAFGGENDANVEPGGAGSRGHYYACLRTTDAVTTHGGGTLRLIASGSVTIAGQILVAGENKQGSDPVGGAGGGVQIAADTINITGAISTAGGTASGYGRVRLLYGKTMTNTGTIIGTVTQGRRPPLQLTSATQANPALVYNDAFEKVSIAHERAFADAQGYLHSIDQSEHAPPQPSVGTFSAAEAFDVNASAFHPGDNWVHLASIDANSALGSVESRFKVTINDDPPAANSTSHTSPTTWYANANPYFAWTNPNGFADASFRRVHYVLDHFGDTVPTKSDTPLPITQKQLLVSGLADGIWVFHVITEDTAGNLTKKASHVVVRVGPDPGTGTVFGSVFDETNHPVQGAVVRVNRGLFQGTTNSSGTYSISGVAAGAWEISVQYPDHTATAQQLTVSASGQASANFTLAHI